MPIPSFGALATAPIGDFGVVSLRVEGVQLDVVKEFSLTSNFLTPTDPFHMSLAHDQMAPEVRSLLKAGSAVEIWIDEVPQFAGYIDSFRFDVDRNGGTVMEITGRDSLSPVVDSQIDPDHHYPDKTPLEKLLSDILVDIFGFEDIDTSNVEDVEVRANLALKQKRGGGSKHKRHRKKTAHATHVKQLPLPKSKPEHNDTFYQFLSRILNRLGLWFWPTVDGKRVIIGTPNYDQEAIAQLRRVVGGLNNNILSGGIRVDTVGQPSFIHMRGNIPPTSRSYSETKVVIDNSIAKLASPTLGLGEAFRNSAGTREQIQAALLGQAPDFAPAKPKPSLATTAFKFSRSHGGNPDAIGGGVGALRAETGTYSEAMAKASPIYEQVFKRTVKIPAKPIEVPNYFASKRARPVFLRDKNSHTLEQLTRSARKQMSLYARKAFVANYTFEGLYLDGVIPQPDTIINVIDEPAQFDGNLWVLSRTIRQSRHGGTTTSLELLIPGALQF